MRKTRQRSRFYQNRLASSLQGVFIIKKVYGHKGGRASESHTTRGYNHRPNGGSESLYRVIKRPISPHPLQPNGQSNIRVPRHVFATQATFGYLMPL